MARKIIVFPEPTVDPVGQTWSVTGIFWLVANPNNPRPLPNASSILPSVVVPGAGTWGLTPAELDDLKTGLVIEQPFSFVTNTAGLTVNQTVTAVGSQAVTAYNAAQAALTAKSPTSKFIGSSYNGTAWVIGP